MIQPMDNRWTLFEATKSRDINGGQKEEKVDEDGGTLPVRKNKMTQMMFRRISPSRRKSTLHKHDEGRQLPGVSEANCA